MGGDALRPAGFIFPFVLVSACAQGEPLRVHETITNIHALDGKIVRVAGYLGECEGYDCGLFETKDDFDRLRRIMADVRGGGRPNLDDMPDWLGIDSGQLICSNPSAPGDCYSDVDKKAAPFTHSYVVVTARVSDDCRDEQLRPGCTDRATDLEPILFEKWTPSFEKTP